MAALSKIIHFPNLQGFFFFFFLKMLQLKFISALTSYVHKRLEIIQPLFLPWPNLQICKFALSFLCMFDFSRFGFTPVWLTSSRDFSELMGVSPSLLGHEGKASDSYTPWHQFYLEHVAAKLQWMIFWIQGH